MERVEPFGETLREWRARRGLSQLELSLRADVSARHISFIETGRSRPSRSMVMRLAGSLDLPLREQNVLLLAAGFAPHYGERPLSDAEMAGARRALRIILQAREPYPAFALDRHWNLILWNRTQEMLLRDAVPVGGTLADLNALDLVFRPGPVREQILNWTEVAAAVLRRLRRQIARLGPDERLAAALARVLESPGVAAIDAAGRAADPEVAPPILVPLRMHDGRRTLSWFTTLEVFGATGEATLEELVVESFYPADDATRAFIEEVAPPPASMRQLMNRPAPRLHQNRA